MGHKPELLVKNMCSCADLPLAEDGAVPAAAAWGAPEQACTLNSARPDPTSEFDGIELVWQLHDAAARLPLQADRADGSGCAE